jgi:hypothetical protein
MTIFIMGKMPTAPRRTRSRFLTCIRLNLMGLTKRKRSFYSQCIPYFGAPIAHHSSTQVDKLISYMKSKPGVWFATEEQVARYLQQANGSSLH